MKLDNSNVKVLKKDFPIFSHDLGLVYLDNAATSQKPKAVIKAMDDFIERDNANVGRGTYTIAERAMRHYSQARKAVADFISAEPEEVIFTRNTTEGINLLSYTISKMIPVGKDEILLTEMEHHSNLVPWQQLAKRYGLNLKFIRIKEDFTLDLEDLKEKLTEKTAILAMTQASNVLGTINPVKEIVKLAKEKGALVVIDAAQAIQHMPVDVKDLGCDFLVFSSHKVLGPNGIGVLYGKKQLFESMSPFMTGGGMIERVSLQDSTWAKIPEKFEAGTQNIPAAVGLAKSIDYLKSIGFQEIMAWERFLLRYTLKRLKEIPDIKIYNPGEESSVSLVSFNLLGIHPHDVAELLNQKKIAIRAGHMCAMPLMSVLKSPGGVCRASLAFYNTLEDIDALVESLKEIQEKFK